MFSYILDTSILNAYQLWKHARKNWTREKLKRKGSFITFKLELAEKLIGSYRKRSNKGRPRTSARDDRLDTTLNHCPEFNEN